MTEDLIAAVRPAAPRNEPEAKAIERPMLEKAPEAAIVPRLIRPIDVLNCFADFSDLANDFSSERASPTMRRRP